MRNPGRPTTSRIDRAPRQRDQLEQSSAAVCRKAPTKNAFAYAVCKRNSVSVMILPQVHLRKPCYDFYFLKRLFTRMLHISPDGGPPPGGPLTVHWRPGQGETSPGGKVASAGTLWSPGLRPRPSISLSPLLRLTGRAGRAVLVPLRSRNDMPPLPRRSYGVCRQNRLLQCRVKCHTYDFVFFLALSTIPRVHSRPDDRYDPASLGLEFSYKSLHNTAFVVDIRRQKTE